MSSSAAENKQQPRTLLVTDGDAALVETMRLVEDVSWPISTHELVFYRRTPVVYAMTLGCRTSLTYFRYANIAAAGAF